MENQGATASDDGAQFLEQCHAALHQHTGGNPRPFLELWSRAPDVSLMGGVGGHQVGIDAGHRAAGGGCQDAQLRDLESGDARLGVRR
jgi:hypothetical protein